MHFSSTSTTVPKLQYGSSNFVSYSSSAPPDRWNVTERYRSSDVAETRWRTAKASTRLSGREARVFSHFSDYGGNKTEKNRKNRSDSPSPPTTEWKDDYSVEGSKPEVEPNYSTHPSSEIEAEVPSDMIREGAVDRWTLDADPVVPPKILRRVISESRVYNWRENPSHIFVAMLLQCRGLNIGRYPEIFNYHMAELFLRYISICQEGSFFLHYAPGYRPKERFMKLQFCATDRFSDEGTDFLPYLITLKHRSAVTTTKAIPLHQFVGVTLGPEGPGFAPFLINATTIKGCKDYSGHHRAFPTFGTFRLLFHDHEKGVTDSIDLLTCDESVYDIWTKTFSGIVSVNSSSVVQVPLTDVPPEHSTFAEDALNATIKQAKNAKQ